MRTAFILSFLANLVLAVAALVLSPATVAIHFGYGGEPDGWAPAYVSALIMVGANGVLFLALYFIPSPYPQNACSLDQSSQQGILVERRKQKQDDIPALGNAVSIRHPHFHFYVRGGVAFAPGQPVKPGATAGKFVLVAPGNVSGLCRHLDGETHTDL
jgi:hypothetical protein